jgi:hypothetical protein
MAFIATSPAAASLAVRSHALPLADLNGFVAQRVKVKAAAKCSAGVTEPSGRYP